MFCDTEVFSRKVFVGGLPIDITETEVKQTFQKFGALLVDWPCRSMDFSFAIKKEQGWDLKIEGGIFKGYKGGLG
ncbi:unnamed protein product [Meloidogyne enterolobii]|uniref:Uncharacterized protein n=1 Tax=Meloidogyne enterolobii TaxID=390850 RepID=A0ACB0ZQQ2_MELEN